MIDRAYVRFREDLPDNQNTFCAADGFAMQGVPVVPFHGFGDLEELHRKGDLTPRTIVCGHIGDVHEALRLFGLLRPEPVDYPDHLAWLCGRDIRRTTLGEVRASVERCFVKPVVQKAFTGLVWDPLDPTCRIKLAVQPDELECFTSELVDFRSEWRCFVRDGELVGVQHYRGDCALGFDRKRVERAVEEGRGKMPAGHALDIGVVPCEGTPYNQHAAWYDTLLVEANDGFALGSYGLPSIIYARLMEARWLELVKGAEGTERRQS